MQSDLHFKGLVVPVHVQITVLGDVYSAFAINIKSADVPYFLSIGVSILVSTF